MVRETRKRPGATNEPGRDGPGTCNPGLGSGTSVWKHLWFPMWLQIILVSQHRPPKAGYAHHCSKARVIGTLRAAGTASAESTCFLALRCSDVHSSVWILLRKAAPDLHARGVQLGGGSRGSSQAEERQQERYVVEEMSHTRRSSPSSSKTSSSHIFLHPRIPFVLFFSPCPSILIVPWKLLQSACQCCPRDGSAHCAESVM